MSYEEFACYSVGNGELLKVCILELDLVSISVSSKSSDGIMKNQCLRDEEEDWGRKIRGSRGQ